MVGFCLEEIYFILWLGEKNNLLSSNSAPQPDDLYDRLTASLVCRDWNSLRVVIVRGFPSLRTFQTRLQLCDLGYMHDVSLCAGILKRVALERLSREVETMLKTEVEVGLRCFSRLNSIDMYTVECLISSHQDPFSHSRRSPLPDC